MRAKEKGGDVAGSSGGTWRQWVWAVVVSAVVGAVFVEVVLRVWQPFFVCWDNQLPPIYVPDAVLGYRYQAGASGEYARLGEFRNVVRINAAGWHDRDIARPKPRGTFRIVCVGDSFTAGLEVPVDQTYPKALEAQLRRQHPGRRFDVVNLGLDGTGTDVQASILRRDGLAYGPDLVLLGTTPNDWRDCQHELRFRTVHDRRVLSYQNRRQLHKLRSGTAGAKAFLKATAGASYGVRALYYIVYGRVPSNYLTLPRGTRLRFPRLDDPALTQHVEELIVGMRRRSAKVGARFGVVLLPGRGEVLSPTSRPAFDRLVPILRRHGIPWLDLEPALRQAPDRHDLFWRYDDHPTARGYQRFGRLVTDWLSRQGLLDGPTSANRPTTMRTSQP